MNPNLHQLLGLALATLVVAQLGAQKQVTESHPDGRPYRVYTVDAAGQRDGKFEQFRDDGQIEVRANYQAGELHGKYESFFDNGKRSISAGYNKGRKHGQYREFAEDGRKLLFETYRYDVLNGSYQLFHDNGQKKLLANYRNGELHGRYQQFSADQSWHRQASYKVGKLHGKVTIKRGREIISKQKWSGGRILDLDGIVPFPRQEAVLRSKIIAILQPPAAKSVPESKKNSKRKQSAPAIAADPKAKLRAAALRRLQAYRYLCGLRYEDMELRAKWNDLCDAASEVCRALGRLSHHPPQPAGFDAARYAQGKLGASRSNLSMGSSMARSVDSYMDDSDPSNIDRIGHRRWCINPSMRYTGFGSSDRFSAMWSMDGSGSSPRGMAAVFYPPPGKVPVDFFGPRHAWSISVLRGPQPKSGGNRITIHALDEYFQPEGEALSLDYNAIAGGGFGAGKCMVFRPVGLIVQPGKRYLARISFDGGKTEAFRYLVEFCEPIQQ